MDEFLKRLRDPDTRTQDDWDICNEAADEICRLRNLYKETCEEKNEEIFEWIEHSKQLVLISQQWQEENARLRAILRWVVDTDPTVLRTADVHTDCRCHRCAMDAARTELGRDFGEKE